MMIIKTLITMMSSNNDYNKAEYTIVFAKIAAE